MRTVSHQYHSRTSGLGGHRSWGLRGVYGWSGLDAKTRENVWKLAAGLAFAIVVMLVPLWLVTRYSESAGLGAAAAATGTAAGIGAIFRSISRDVLRTSIGVASRAAARSLSHHWTNLVMHTLARVMGKDPAKYRHHEPHPTVSIMVGTIAMGLSYVGVLILASPESRHGVLNGMSLWLAAVLVILPLLTYFLLTHLAGHLFEVQIIPRTEADGLLLQLYFTLAVSFLPLTCDCEYRGPRNNRAKAAIFTMLGLCGGHLLFSSLATWLALPALSHLAMLYLLYAFVLSFPFYPLDGSHIWGQSKLLWLCCWIPITAAFHSYVPEAFYDLL